MWDFKEIYEKLTNIVVQFTRIVKSAMTIWSPTNRLFPIEISRNSKICCTALTLAWIYFLDIEVLGHEIIEIVPITGLHANLFYSKTFSWNVNWCWYMVEFNLNFLNIFLFNQRIKILLTQCLSQLLEAFQNNCYEK